MANSKAKKQRLKQVREGSRNPELSRSPFVFQDMRTRKSKTKKDHMYQHKHKHQNFQNGDTGVYFFLTKMS